MFVPQTSARKDCAHEVHLFGAGITHASVGDSNVALSAMCELADIPWPSPMLLCGRIVLAARFSRVLSSDLGAHGLRSRGSHF